MLSVQEAATMLGVSGSRVRAMLKSGQLQGRKFGNAWAVFEQSVIERLNAGSRPGRPSTSPAPDYVRVLPDVDAAHRIYDEAVRVLPGCYDASFLDQARSEEERAFWIHVADFFLQQKQREPVKDGVF